MEHRQSFKPLTLKEQLCANLLSSIRRGQYATGDKLPSEHELECAFGVSRVTVRAALDELVQQGVLVKRQGKGTFVQAPTYRESIFSSGSFTDTCMRLGAAPSTAILSVGTVPAERAIAERLRGDVPSPTGTLAGGPEAPGKPDAGEAGAGDELVRIERLRSVNGVPCIIEVDYFPASYAFLAEMDLSDRSLLAILNDRAHVTASQFTDTFTTVPATGEQAGRLRCEPGLALLKVEQTVADAAGVPIYVNHQFIVTERYVYSVRSSK